MEILNSTASELARALRARKISSKELTQFYLDRIERIDSRLNTVITINPNVLKEAEEVDEKIARGEEVGRLAGLPLGVKDIFCTKGLKTTAGSKVLENFVPPYSATVIEKTRKDGALVLAKLNMDEFAMGSSNESSHFGPVRNPWNEEFVPGGSSGGSAAALAGGLCPLALGTDTGGSIRQPAHFCGVVGLKPTYGRVSRYGIVAFASSLDQAGPMALSVEDAALLLESISGADDYDGTCSKSKVPPFSKELRVELKGAKVGLPKEYFTDDLDPDVRATMANAIEALRREGVEFVDVSLPLVKYAVPVYYMVATSEASSNLSRYDGVRFGYRSDFQKNPPKDLVDFYSRNRSESFGEEVKRRIMLGTYALSSGYYDAYYLKASQLRRLIRGNFEEAFKSCDLLLSPVATTPAFRVGEKSSDPVQMYLNDIFTTSTNLAGLPGMSVPGGFSSNGLPIGIQLTGRHFEEQRLLNFALGLEKLMGIKERIASGVR